MAQKDDPALFLFCDCFFVGIVFLSSAQTWSYRMHHIIIQNLRQKRADISGTRIIIIQHEILTKLQSAHRQISRFAKRGVIP